MTMISPDETTSVDAATRRLERAGWLFGGVAALIWGAFLAVSRQGIGAGLYASDLAFLRYLVAGPLLLPWIFRHGLRDLGGVGWRRFTRWLPQFSAMRVISKTWVRWHRWSRA